MQFELISVQVVEQYKLIKEYLT